MSILERVLGTARRKQGASASVGADITRGAEAGNSNILQPVVSNRAETMSAFSPVPERSMVWKNSWPSKTVIGTHDPATATAEMAGRELNS